MKRWNYRMLVQPDGDDYFFSVHSVHYKNDVPYAYSKEPAPVSGNCIGEMMTCINFMKEAIQNKPVLWAGEKFPQEFDYDKMMKK